MTTDAKPADIGALSRVDPDAVKAALAGVASGKVYDLGLEINDRIPNGAVRFSLAFITTPEMTAKTTPFQLAIEMVVGTLHISTHMDALVHVQKDGRIYGGELARDVREDSGWKKFGMETVPPMIGRGLILDVARVKGYERLPDPYGITVDDIKATLHATGEQIRKGDFVLVRTGKIQQYGDPKAFVESEPGLTREAAIWMYDQGMAVLGTDTAGTEPVPVIDPANTTHHAMLVERGVHLIENLNLEDVVKANVTSGLFIALPLKITGATASWLRPVLIV
jgi:kynurenine formamidase